MRTVSCKMCGESFATEHPSKMYCSRNCKNKAQYQRQKAKVFGFHRQQVCRVCGKEFENKNPKSVYCSCECRSVGTKKQKMQWYYNQNGISVEAKVGNTATCEICGKEFLIAKRKQICCSKECLDEYTSSINDVSKVHGEGFSYVKYRPKKDINKNLDRLAAMAKANNMSYGQLVAAGYV